MKSERKRIRLLELRSTYGWGGGPDKTILLSAARHDPQRFDVLVVYLRGTNDGNFDIGARAKRLGLQFYEIPDRGKIDFGAVRTLAKFCREKQVDIVHSHDYKTNVIAYLIWRFKRGFKLVTTSHGWIRQTSKMQFYTWLDLRVLRRIPNIIAVSDATRHILTSNGIPESRIRVIHNCIDEQTWSADSVQSTFKQELGISEATPVLGTVGRLSKEKDLELFLQVGRHVVDKYPTARLVLVGTGVEADNLKAYSRQLKIADNVVFTGYRKDLANIYKALDLHIATSLTEGLPNTLLEAMAMGVPTVSTNVGGIVEIIRNGYNGYLVQTRDVDGLSSRVLSLLADRQDYDRIRGNARKTVEDRFSFTSRMKAIEAFYTQLLSN